MSLILILLLIYLIYIASKSKSRLAKQDDQIYRASLEENNKRWTRLLHGRGLTAKTKSQKDFFNTLIVDALSQGLINAEYLKSLDSDNSEYSKVLKNAKEVTRSSISISSEVNMNTYNESLIEEDDLVEEKSKRDSFNAAKLDSISILLYFGAFLFVASVGLFVAFASADGWIRALSVLILCLALYTTGHWIYRTKTALKPAGIAFIGMGVAIAPLVGATVYGYVDNTSPELVWLLTSIFCLGLYSHAILKIRQPILDYVFIFTLLSLFESSVAVFDFPTYFFGWIMVALGLVLHLISIWKEIIPDFRSVSKSGGSIYVPLAIFVSLILLADKGFGQLGITLILSSMYYALVYKTSNEYIEKQYSALASQVSLLIGLGSVFYGFSSSTLATGVFLSFVSLLHIAVILLRSKESIIAKNFASCMLALSLVCLPLTYSNLLVTSTVVALVVIQGLIVWWHQNRSDSYILSGFAWSLLPLILGQLALSPSITANWQAIWLILSLIIHISFFLLGTLPRLYNSAYMLSMARLILIFNVLVLMLFSLSLTPLFSLGFLAVLGLLIWILTWFDRQVVWSLLSGLAVSTSVITTWSSPIISLSIIISLIFNILLSLRFRSESNRWISTVLWLILPLGLGGIYLSDGWSAIQYGWFYLAVMLGLIISRMIARGAVFASSKIPIAAYARNASMSYATGYTMAGIISFVISLSTLQSGIGSSFILIVLSGLIFVSSCLAEKKPEILLLQPILWQIILIALIKPAESDIRLNIFLVVSILLALAIYNLSNILLRSDSITKLIDDNIIISSLLTAFVAPASFMIVGETNPIMIIGLFVASSMLFHYWRYRDQGYKELAISIMVIAFMWLLHFYGIREFQAYTHIIALTLAGFAWWRHTEGDKKKGDEYIYFALATATVPLALQALSNESGGIYGWWLLIEQVVFMLIGISIRKKFVVMWGLYVAIASVLYQLRNLGFAALAVLACFVIGIAIYQLQKYNKPDK